MLKEEEARHDAQKGVEVGPKGGEQLVHAGHTLPNGHLLT